MLYLGAVAYSRDGFLGRRFDTNVEVGRGTSLSAGAEHRAWDSDVRRYWTQHFHGDAHPHVSLSAHH